MATGVTGAGGAASGAAARARALLASVACISRESIRECDRPARAAGSSREAASSLSDAFGA
jgi:hypothetical protein